HSGSRATRDSGAGALRGMSRVGLRHLGLLFVLALAGCGSEADSAVDRATGQAAAKPTYGDTFIDALTGNILCLIPKPHSTAESTPKSPATWQRCGSSAGTVWI